MPSVGRDVGRSGPAECHLEVLCCLKTPLLAFSPRCYHLGPQGDGHDSAICGGRERGPWVASTGLWVKNVAMPTLGYHATVQSNKPGEDETILLDLKNRALSGKWKKEIWPRAQFHSCK